MCPPCGLIQASFGEPERISKNKSSIGTCVSRMPLMTSIGAESLSSQPAVLRDILGRSEIRWGERLQYVAEIGEGDFAYFAPYVPHQERNLSDRDAQVFLVVRSGNEGFVTKLEGETVERPETVF